MSIQPDLPNCHGIIPARFASSRFPGKPLADILGRPMFWHVYQRARACPALRTVTLATDDSRILEAARACDIPALMTRADHPSGTDRVLEAAEALGLSENSVVVNIQGDEPALHPDLLSCLLTPFTDPETQVATLARRVDAEEARNPDVVKVVLDGRGRALYFSRSPIPHAREGVATCLGHIGLYAFRMRALRKFVALGPGKLEQIEKLEQLRLLEAAIPIHVLLTDHGALGVDRPEDIPRACSMLHDLGFD
ncbi:3-deoxy-manno-octulosonate cytidylyltransferase (CMP-KDO synthetase) [Desulfonatronum thiosulfatophilum]|uniref:3-deoxy-manno-octulosonate cytidylyltransferase n=1 Tax=Desulfonatronum thiosulfatophilum TaxID=617002 RepID=A0A1G6D3I5_9BACT|nr:3-deoxy-manno-octulosonate cytidylyltransferase [Desulfonatronum thiosulfatophilum]SDB39650.1 3-deoxy-manno-octulosonate cytidylyltransferase (CMP-KDO synthetase) [Desulfonatronum thiosulfatophilum]